MSTPIEHVKPQVITINIDGLDIDVSPITVGQYPALFAHMNPLLGVLARSPDGLLDRLQDATPTAGDLMWFAEQMAEHGVHLIAALAVAVNQPRDWVSKLLPDRALELLVVALQVNTDFFSRARAAMKASARAMPQRQPAEATAGPTPSAP